MKLLLFGRREKAGRDDLWFCSELFAAAYSTQGHPIVESDDGYTSPEDLARSPKVRLRFRIKEG